MSHRPSFNDELHRRLDGDEEVELAVPVLRSFADQVKEFGAQRGWDQPATLRQLLAAGLAHLTHDDHLAGAPGDLPLDKRLGFLQQRWGQVEAAYSTLKFQAYQVMNQNDGLEMNLKGLLPQLEAARSRIEQLEGEVQRLRCLVPSPADGQGNVYLPPPAWPEERHEGMSGRIRRLFGGKE